MGGNEQNEIYKLIESFSSDIIKMDFPEIAVILAAGHGKRIKSQKSKMLHNIWGIPTVERVYNACKNGISEINVIVVVGIKAKDVILAIGKRERTKFAYQETQNGTGHAVQVALERLKDDKFEGIVYVLPGDMGLINSETMKQFRDEFIKTNSDMTVLTGIYEGDPKNNSYGRIIRVKDKDRKGNPSGKDLGKVIEIMEYKDILSLPEDKPYEIEYKDKIYSFSKNELLNNNEFNSGVYAFRYKKLIELLHSLSNNNVQNEIYITDLISLFNRNNYSVTAVSPKEQYVLMGFNNKSVLREMEALARKQVYDKLKDIIEIDDPEDFFIDQSVVDKIIEMDKKNIPLDITIGKGTFIGKGVKLNYNLTLEKNVFVSGNVIFGKNVSISQNVHLSCFSDQTFEIGDNVEILSGDIVKGNIIIGEEARIESSVNMTGSNEYPLRIGKRVLVKGTSYIFGSIIENDVHIEHSVLVKKIVDKLIKRDGTIQPIKFYLPMPEGIDAVENIE